ncbi:SH3 domain-containing protein [Pararhodobacter oceanensis]|uniref:Aspartyl-trna synthetase n=1 Tax=Pararhodobacter oceanensis TaxID=2172121 RepID=A0A2T8HYQ7_9RHOB|nr:SH3 domain-containing protein [Pararhodobacter oceanensis]PVH30575.1 aspartyl-trna synthetase [Pararhodobacter oceanensis]
MRDRLIALLLALITSVATLGSALPVHAQAATREAGREAGRQEVGPETGLPIPRYVSLKTSRGRARRGPSMSHRVDWIFARRDLPLRVTGEFEHWRRIEDSEGLGGWIHYSLLSGVRTVLVTEDMVPMRRTPAPEALEVALLEANVVAHIMECTIAWCRLSVDGARGWVERRALWGLDPDEVLD